MLAVPAGGGILQVWNRGNRHICFLIHLRPAPDNISVQCPIRLRPAPDTFASRARYISVQCPIHFLPASDTFSSSVRYLCVQRPIRLFQCLIHLPPVPNTFASSPRSNVSTPALTPSDTLGSAPSLGYKRTFSFFLLWGHLPFHGPLFFVVHG